MLFIIEIKMYCISNKNLLKINTQKALKKIYVKVHILIFLMFTKKLIFNF